MGDGKFTSTRIYLNVLEQNSLQRVKVKLIEYEEEWQI